MTMHHNTTYGKIDLNKIYNFNKGLVMYDVACVGILVAQIQ